VLGAGHVGTLEVLQARGFQPDLVVGASAGAIVGAIYACSSVDAVNEFLDTLASTFGSTRAMLLNTPQKLFAHVEELLANYVPRDYLDVKLPFYPVATNLRTGQHEAFSHGDPIAGILASAAYPGVFPAQEIEGELYADGGMSANLPASVARDLGATFIVGSNIYMPPELTPAQIRRLNFVESIERSLDIMQASLARQQAELCDFCFTPPVLSVHKWYHFNAVVEIREEGRRYAQERIRALPEDKGDLQAWLSRSRR